MEINDKNILIFDEINRFSINILKKFHNIEIIYYFKCSENIQAKLLQDSDSYRNIKFIALEELEYPFTRPYSQMKAHEKLDQIYDNLIKNTKVLKLLQNLYSSSEIELVYKKELIGRLQFQYDKEMMINHIAVYTNKKIIYISDFNYSSYGNKSILYKKIEIISLSTCIKLSYLRKNFKETLLLFFPFYILIKSFGGFKFRKERKLIKVAINSNLPGVFAKNHHYYYYLTDSLYGIKKEDYLLVDDRYGSKASSDDSINHKDINYYNVYEKMPLSLNLIWKIFSRFLYIWIGCFLGCLFKSPDFIISTRLILADYIKWNVFFDRYVIEKYVNVLMPDNSSKCIIFNQNGVKTFFIYPDNYTDDYHSGMDEKILAQTYFCYMKYDCAVVYGDKTKRYFEKSKNKIDSYIKSGVIHSQRVEEIQTGICKKKLDVADLFDVKPKKIIGVFDISFVNWGFMHKKDAIKFSESIFRLLDEFDDIGIIFKEKKDISKYSDLYEAYKKIGEHPRGVYIRKDEGSDIYSYDVISISDLVVSACFTSTHAEALGSKTRSIYYDVKGDYIGDNFYFNTFPDMVAHNYEELRNLVEKWLYKISDSEFDSYLENYVKGEIDEFMDQKAIDRLKKVIYDN